MKPFQKKIKVLLENIWDYQCENLHYFHHYIRQHHLSRFHEVVMTNAKHRISQILAFFYFFFNSLKIPSVFFIGFSKITLKVFYFKKVYYYLNFQDFYQQLSLKQFFVSFAFKVYITSIIEFQIRPMQYFICFINPPPSSKIPKYRRGE